MTRTNQSLKLPPAYTTFNTHDHHPSQQCTPTIILKRCPPPAAAAVAIVTPSSGHHLCECQRPSRPFQRRGRVAFLSSPSRVVAIARRCYCCCRRGAAAVATVPWPPPLPPPLLPLLSPLLPGRAGAQIAAAARKNEK